MVCTLSVPEEELQDILKICEKKEEEEEYSGIQQRRTV